MTVSVLAAVDDLIFVSKIRGTAELLKVNVQFARSADALLAKAAKDLPSLIILDLHSTLTDACGLAEKLKADDVLRHVPIVAFFSHVQTELQKRAIQSGIEHVLPRSVFTRQLSQILLGHF